MSKILNPELQASTPHLQHLRRLLAVGLWERVHGTLQVVRTLL